MAMPMLLDLERYPGDLARKGDRAAEPFLRRSRGCLVGRALTEHAELVAAEPGHELALADRVVQARRDDGQQLVAQVHGRARR